MLLQVDVHSAQFAEWHAGRAQGPVAMPAELDPGEVAALLPRVCGLSGDLYDDPILGPIQQALRWVPVSRGGALAGMRDAIRDTAIRRFLVFPEGKCSNGGQILAFHKGVFACACECGAAVQPVVLRYVCGGGFDCSNTGRPEMIPWLMVRGMLSWSHEMEVYWCPVMTPDTEHHESPELFAERVRRAMAEALNVPMLPQSSVQKKSRE